VIATAAGGAGLAAASSRPAGSGTERFQLMSTAATEHSRDGQGKYQLSAVGIGARSGGKCTLGKPPVPLQELSRLHVSNSAGAVARAACGRCAKEAQK